MGSQWRTKRLNECHAEDKLELCRKVAETMLEMHTTAGLLWRRKIVEEDRAKEAAHTNSSKDKAQGLGAVS